MRLVKSDNSCNPSQKLATIRQALPNVGDAHGTTLLSPITDPASAEQILQTWPPERVSVDYGKCRFPSNAGIWTSAIRATETAMLSMARALFPLRPNAYAQTNTECGDHGKLPCLPLW